MGGSDSGDEAWGVGAGGGGDLGLDTVTEEDDPGILKRLRLRV